MYVYVYLYVYVLMYMYAAGKRTDIHQRPVGRRHFCEIPSECGVRWVMVTTPVETFCMRMVFLLQPGVL